MTPDWMNPDAKALMRGDDNDPYSVAPLTGRALDAAIAERLFGWTDVREHQMWSLGENDESEPDGTQWMGQPPIRTHPEMHAWLPHYSTEIAAAWTILKHIRENWIFSKRERFFDALKQEARLTDGTSISWPAALIAWQDSFPEKLCRAALAAEASRRASGSSDRE